MSDIFKIGVALMLTQNGVAPALAAMSHQLIGIHRSVGQINSGFGRWRTALVGAAGVMGGTALLGGLAKVAAYGEKFLDQQAKLQLLGLNNKQIAEATAKAWAITRAVPGTTVEGNLKSIGEMFNPVGFEHSIAMSQKMAQLDMVLKQVTGKEGSAYTTVKAGELMGVFTNAKTKQFDAEGFDKFMDVVGRSAIASHGRVTPDMWLAFAKQAGPGASNLSESGMMAAMEIMQGMGGFRAGTAMQALNRQFAGGIMAQRVATELEDLGIAKKGDFEIGRGGHVTAKRGAMKDVAEGLMNNPLDAVVDLIMPKLIAKGFDTNEKLSAEIYRIIGTGPGQRLMYELGRNSGQMKSSIDRSMLAMPIDKGLEALNANSPIAAKGAVSAAFGNMMTALGSEGLRAAVPLMLELTKFFNAVGAFAAAHPTAMKIIGEGLVVLGAGLIAAGGIALVAAFGAGGWFVLGIGALGVAIMNFEAIWKKFVGWIQSLAGLFQNSAFGHLLGLGAGPITNAAPPPAEQPGTQYRGDVWLDGDKVGEVVSNGMAKKMGGSLTGSALFDPVRSAVPSDSAFGIP